MPFTVAQIQFFVTISIVFIDSRDSLSVKIVLAINLNINVGLRFFTGF